MEDSIEIPALPHPMDHTRWPVISTRNPIGVVWFDDAKEVKLDKAPGWASECGGPPFRIAKAADLSNDALWVTNLGFEQFRRSSFDTIRHARMDGFARVTLSGMLGDMGLSSTEGDRPELVRLLSHLHHRILALMERYYPDAAIGRTLADSIKTKFPKTINLGFQTWLASAIQESSNVFQQWENNTIKHVLRPNRAMYAMDLMSKPIPAGQPVEIALSDMPAPAERHKWLMECGQPFIIEGRVNMECVDAATAGVIAFGSQSHPFHGLRNCMTHIEYAWVSTFAPIEVKRVLMYPRYEKIPYGFLPPRALTEDWLMRYSWSAGVLMECHLAALMSKEHMRASKTYEHTAMGCWIRATDRAKSFLSAYRAQNDGLKVWFYGYGGVGVFFSNTQADNLEDDAVGKVMQHALKNAMSYPIFHNIPVAEAAE